MASKTQERRAALVKDFVGCFELLGDMTADEILSPASWQLATGEGDTLGRKKWRPLHTATDKSELDALYLRLPARLPKAFEDLLLGYRWAEVDLEIFTLMASPPGPGLDGFLGAISEDRNLWKELIPAGYIRFGKGSGGDYDPVCFDIKKRTKNGDYRVVEIDHEQILCNYRVKVVAELAPTFEDLMRQTIERAKRATK